MLPWPEHHGNPALADEVVRTLHVVRALDLVVDVLDARARGREQRNLVVDLVDAQQGRIADAVADACVADGGPRSEEHTSELQSLMRISYAVFCLQKKKKH